MQYILRKMCIFDDIGETLRENTGKFGWFYFFANHMVKAKQVEG